MKMDNCTHHADNGSCVGLTSSALPEAKNKILADSSDTGVSTHCMPAKAGSITKNLKNNRTGMLSELPTEERRKPTTTS